MSEDGGALCSPAVLFYTGVVAALSVLALLTALYGEMRVLAWASAASSVAASLVVAVCVWGLVDG